MPERDASLGAGHPDAAGWVLGALDAEDAEKFRDHLASCLPCQAAVAELEPVARMLPSAAPAVTPPPGLQARTLAKVQQAARTAQRPARAPVWRRWWNARPLALAVTTCAAAAIAVFAVLQVLQPAPALAYTFPLHSQAGGVISGQAAVRHAAAGWSVTVTVRGLPGQIPSRRYKVWLASAGTQPGQPRLLGTGTATVAPHGTATVHIQSAVNPRTFTAVRITLRQVGDAGQHGQVILTGLTRP